MLSNHVLGFVIGWVPGTWEIILILFAILLLFGGKKIPELMKGIGKGIKEFKEGIAGEEKNKSTTDEEKTVDK